MVGKDMVERTRGKNIQRFPTGETVEDVVAVEEPLKIRLHGEDLVVLMRTPGHDQALVAGFLLAEGVVETPDDIRSIAPCADEDDADNVMAVELREGCPWDPESVRRTALSSTSCGVCGKTTIDNLLARCKPFGQFITLDEELLNDAPQRAHELQTLFASTGGIHAAALLRNADRTMVGFAEDVGRHNAIDKVLGRALLDGQTPLDGHVLWVSGRSSFDVIQKALAARVQGVICVGAPTSMAVELAQESRLTLVGFSKDSSRYNVYAGSVRR
jgi:FdhD protein